MLLHATELAIEIASKSPVAIAATKHQLNYARDHTVEEGLDYVVSNDYNDGVAYFSTKQNVSCHV